MCRGVSALEGVFQSMQRCCSLYRGILSNGGVLQPMARVFQPIQGCCPPPDALPAVHR